jgi:hypothetical protein
MAENRTLLTMPERQSSPPSIHRRAARRVKQDERAALKKLVVMKRPAVSQDDLEELYYFGRRAREAMQTWRGNPAAALKPNTGRAQTFPPLGNELRSFFKFAGERGYTR